MSLKLMSSVVLSTLNPQEKPEVLDKLLKQLLECVQECQRRYGGKQQLATEFDSCVAGLCLSLEAIFLHGLKTKSWLNQPQNSSLNETLKQVTGIVSQSLHIGQEQPSFWALLKRLLTTHDIERYNALKQIWTDTGRCRAWLRSTLNERCLERYLQKFLQDKVLLSEYYESWAILRDEEKNSLLPNMAAGLGSILFAINIDKPELNSSVISRSVSGSQKTEPIIEAPILETQAKRKSTKRKVARQFIAFDDDDATLSTSVPSVSSDTSSESFGRHSVQAVQSIEEDSSDDSKNNVKNQIEDASFSAGKPQRKLSIEISGIREKYATSTPGILTPVSQFDVRELTPVSVDSTNDDCQDPVDSSTDISAVLGVVEINHQNELMKNREEIELLKKENNALKEQIKQYVSAIQMLRTHKDLDENLEGLQQDNFPDYKVEAKLYEKKLIQVAEMHAELMDFNVILQQQIHKKDALLERLKSELEELRGPMSTDQFSSDYSRGTLNVWIPSAFLTGSGSSSYHVYQIFLRAGIDEWNIYRRYAQFHTLHTDLKKLDPVVGSFDFPPKKSIRKKDSALVEDRRKRLQIYLRRVIAHWPELSHCNSKLLLEQHFAFFKDQREDKRNSLASRSTGDSRYSGL